MLLLTLCAAMVSGGQDQPQQHAAAGEDGDGNTLLSAASDNHAWIVAQGMPSMADDDRLQLVHHALDMDGPYFSRSPGLVRTPEAVAVADAKVWLAFRPTESDDGMLRRAVYTVQAQRDPGIGMYHTQPRERLRLVQSLPGRGRLAAFTAGDDGPVALILPLQHEAVSVSRNDDAASEPGEMYEAPGPQLLHLQGNRWQSLPLPEQLPDDLSTAQLAFDRSDRSRLNLLTASPDDPSRSDLHRYNGEQWQTSTISLDSSRVLSLTSHDGHLAAVLRDTDSEAALAYVRDGGLLSLAAFSPPAGSWSVHGMAEGFVLFNLRSGRLYMQPIAPIDGVAGQLTAMRDQPLPAAKLWHTGLMLAVSIVAVLIVLLVRPAPRRPEKLPENVAVLGPVPRLAALVVDLLPGGVLAVLALNVSPAELLRLPMATETLSESAAHLLMLGVTMLHCTIAELLFGTTLGKLIVGGSVASATGDTIKARQVLARNGVKLMILLVPPLAIFAMLNPYMQGFNDMAARTMVLRR